MAVGHRQIKGHKKFSLVTIVLLLLPVVVAYFGWIWVPAWWADSDVNEVIRKWANSAYRTKEISVLRQGIRNDLAKKGVTLDDADLEIVFQEPDKDYIWINYSYDRELAMPLLDKTWHTHWEHAVETDLTRFVW